MQSKELLILVHYPKNISPGQRFRIEQYEQLLAENGFTLTYHSFLNARNFDVNYNKGAIFAKALAVITGFLKRFALLFTIKKYQYIFIYREAAPVGPPILEWLLTKVFNKKIIYDFDDAIWMPYLPTESSPFTRFFKNKGKVKKICALAYKVSCGNQYLCDYARQYNNNVLLNKTCVDTANKYNLTANHHTENITIGWTGSFSTLNYLQLLEPVLKKLQEKYIFSIKVICNAAPALKLKNVEYIPWSEETEVVELAKCQIGLMPLLDEEWSKGKCGFKLIQYMALQIAPVASPYGVNKNIVENNVNGFLCSNDAEWYNAIEKLLLNAALREQMGKLSRKKIAEEFSIESNKHIFLSIFGEF